MIYRPFILDEFNELELYSTLSALITIYSGSLYVSEDISEFVKIIAFTTIVLVNSAFITRWIWSMFEIIFRIYNNFFQKFFPNFTAKYMRLNKKISSKKHFITNISTIKSDTARSNSNVSLNKKSNRSKKVKPIKGKKVFI